VSATGGRACAWCSGLSETLSGASGNLQALQESGESRELGQVLAAEPNWAWAAPGDEHGPWPEIPIPLVGACYKDGTRVCPGAPIFRIWELNCWPPGLLAFAWPRDRPPPAGHGRPPISSPTAEKAASAILSRAPLRVANRFPSGARICRDLQEVLKKPATPARQSASPPPNGWASSIPPAGPRPAPFAPGGSSVEFYFSLSER
jgi:hypothetical protein